MSDDHAKFTQQVRAMRADWDRVPEQRMPSGLTSAQDASLDRLAEAIAAHVKAPCGEPEPCVFHRALDGGE